ncbi:MAG TPA: tetratricopeptide repeat protein [Verrucomicrobiae bacterium]|nr:tetratricopeptide repeat protein [Verrucomicrobiae bacterium]
MKKHDKRKRKTDFRRTSVPDESPGKRRRWPIGLALLGSVLAGIVVWVISSSSEKVGASSTYIPRPQGTLTFNRDIAPVIFNNCAPCHRPGQPAPFSLLDYAEVKKRGELIVEVTEKRYMPPWLPEPGHGNFADERRLSADQIGMIKQWVIEGAIEGRASDLPPLPEWLEGWELGQPDLAVTLPSAYTLAPDGKDVYRNFVVPIPTTERRFVRAVEFRPGNGKVVHHTFMYVDASRQSRHLVDNATPPSFGGMRVPESAETPGGQLLGWQPGKRPYVSPDGLSWVLEKDSDLVLQMHLQPSGRSETVLPAVGFYFTDKPPTNIPYRINLLRYAIDIPPGVRDYSIENRYVLPVDVHLLRILPHTHYLGKELQGYALLPDGAKKWLLLIKNWDFNWQGDYRYAEPVFLPKGTTLVMHFTYDNSADNAHNPNHPPKRVKFGLQSTDEMGELGLQLLPRTPQDREILARDFFVKFTKDAVEENETLLRSDPKDAEAHAKLAVALIVLGRTTEALNHLRTAVELRPDHHEAHSALAGIFIRQKRLEEARVEFETVLRLKPNDYQAYGGLGSVFLMQGNLAEAEACYENALRINPNDPIALSNLERVRKAKRASPARN